jgi:DNA repair protein RadD
MIDDDEVPWEGESEFGGLALNSGLPPLKGYQQVALDQVRQRRSEDGENGRSTLVVAPPGAGKSRVMTEMAEEELNIGGTVLVKVHRLMLMEQLVKDFQAKGHEVGVLAAGYRPNPEARIQVASPATLMSRVVRRGTMELPDASLVMTDEAHQQASTTERSLVFGSRSGQFVSSGWLSRGTDVVGFTATPVMKQRIYMDMVQLANYSDLRREGMHQPIKVYGPEEIDTSKLKPNASGDFSEKALEKRAQTIWGSVWVEWYRLNPDALPTILFAPSVASSRWFAHQWVARGVPAAHIDGEMVMLPGPNGQLKTYPADQSSRRDLLAMSRDGTVKIVCNRFVLREGIDMPWLYHGIFATVMGSVSTYLQSVGRLQRYWPAYASQGDGCKIMQDHGGAYWRHGSPNSDRHWRLGQSAMDVSRTRVRKCMAGELEEGIRCGRCGFWRMRGSVCPSCGHTHTQSVRAVRMGSGRLVQMAGEVHRKPREYGDAAEKIWMGELFGGALAGRTVSQAVAMAFRKAAKKGLTIDLSKVPHKPPGRDTADYHLQITTHYPWLARWVEKVRKKRRR